MDLKLPEKKKVAELFEQPQIFAIEIRIDRVDLFTQDSIDVEDTVLWVQVLDLPCMEMLPYQRDHMNVDSSETLTSSENVDRSTREPSFTNQSVKIAKKASIVEISSTATSFVDVNAAAEEQIRKLRDKRKSMFRKEKIKKQAIKHEKSVKGHKRSSQTSSSIAEISRKKSVSRTLSFKLSEGKKSVSQQEMNDDDLQLTESSKETRFTSRETFKDGESLKKIKLLKKLMVDSEAEPEAPAGVAFNSDCCIVIPFPNVSNALYKMERMPVIIYVVKMSHACSKLVGKVCIPMGYCFQQAVIKAAKLKGGIASHAVQESFPVYTPDKTGMKELKVGYLYGSIKLICYGNFGMTEIKGPNGDLMSSKFREWKSDYRDLSQGLGRDGIDLNEQPYGFTPTVVRNTLPPPGKHCPTIAPLESMFDFIQMFHIT